MSTIRSRFQRPLRLAVVGGGPGSWIGEMHRGAARLDGNWVIVAGVFSSDPQRSRDAGAALGLDAARSYGDVAELLARERERDDGADALAIMTPNDTHYPYAAAALDAGFDVIGDKPVTHDFAQACDLLDKATRGGRLFAITHGYSAYPMIRHARHLVREGVLGEIRLVQVEYLQGGMATRVEDGPRAPRYDWLLDPQRSGLALVMGAIGCHAQHLACFTADRPIRRVSADVGALVPGRTVTDHVSALLEFDGGARGTFTATQAAAGAENDIRLRLFGAKGSLEWSHRQASYLQLSIQGEATRLIGRGDTFLPPEVLAAGRTPRGHPEGLREAFANIYSELAYERMALTLGEPFTPAPYPRIADGAHTMAVIEACIASHASGRWADVAPLPVIAV
ncbi:MAG: Gfo/Idh/MocA family oxidoreductase [Rhodoferax sp.]|nr:Gfo/Idh/MocA family oxidoreductase [Rhodoferax sp.]